MAQEWWSTTTSIPGDIVLTLYSDDSVYHERILLWPAKGPAWAVATPDEDVYVEVLAGGDPNEEPESALYLGAGRQVPKEAATKGVYRFDVWPSDGVLRKLIRDGRTAAHAWCRAEGVALLEVKMARNAARKMVPLDVLFKGQLLTRRLTGRLGAGAVAAAPATAPAAAPAALAVTLPTVGPYDELPAGHIWVAADSLAATATCSAVALGTEIDMELTDFFKNDKGVRALDDGRFVFVKAMAPDQVADYVNRLQPKPIEKPVDAADNSMSIANFKAALRPKEDEEKEEEPDEVRTLPVVFDTHGERYRLWREVANALESDEFSDWPVEGPRAMRWLAKFWARQGCSPTQWLDKHLQTTGYSNTDRSVHELRCIAEVVESAGCYDQMNLASLASFELLARRWQLILEAHSRNPGSPDCDGSEYFEGVEQKFGVAPPVATRACGATDARRRGDRAAEDQGTRASHDAQSRCEGVRSRGQGSCEVRAASGETRPAGRSLARACLHEPLTSSLLFPFFPFARSAGSPDPFPKFLPGRPAACRATRQNNSRCQFLCG